jgi:hypothetical protein
MARRVLGTSIVGTAFWAANNGYLTGAPPLDPAERNQWMANNQPWSVQIGDWVMPINRFDPVATPMVLAASMPQILRDLNNPMAEISFTEGVIGAMSDAVLDKTWFMGVRNMFEAIAEPDRNLEKFAQNIARSFVPAVVQGASRAYDPRTTVPMNMLEAMQDRIGFEKGKRTRTAVDIFGRDIDYEVVGASGDDESIGAVINRFMSPLKGKKKSDDPAYAELENLQVRIAKPPKNINGVALTGHQYYALSKATGKYFRYQLEYALNNPKWDSMRKEQRRYAIEKMKAEASEQGRLVLFTVYPELAISTNSKVRQYKKLTAPTKEEEINRGLTPGMTR